MLAQFLEDKYVEDKIQNNQQKLKQQAQKKKILDTDSILELQQESSSIFTNKNIHKIPKFIIPFLLISIFVLFVSSNNSEIGALSYRISIGEFSTDYLPIQTYKLMDTVKQQWQAQTYVLAIMIFLFSGIWPFVKLVMLFIAWFIPTRYVSYSKREKILNILDALGKFSFFDCLLMNLLMDAFHFQIKIPLKLINPVFSVSMSSYYGYFSFVTATILSLILTHIIIYYHRQTISNETVNESYQNIKQSIIQNSNNSLISNISQDNDFENKNSKNSKIINKSILNKKIQSNVALNKKQSIVYDKVSNKEMGILTKSKKEQILYILLLIGCLIIFTIGIFINTLSIEITGLFGLMLGSEQSVQIYSIWTIGTEIPQNSQQVGFGSTYIMMYFMLICIFIPFLFLTLLITLFVSDGKITLKTQLNIFIIIEIAYAWSSVEVAILLIITSLFEIHDFITFLVGDKCDGINKILQKLENLDILHIPGQATCFDAEMNLESGGYFLLFSSFVYILCGTIILRKIQGKIDKKLQYDIQNQKDILENNKYLVKQKQNKNESNESIHQI